MCSKVRASSCSKQCLELVSQDTAIRKKRAPVCKQLRDIHAPGYLITLKAALRPSVNSGVDEDASLPDFNASVPTFQAKMHNWVLKAQHSKLFEKAVKLLNSFYCVLTLNLLLHGIYLAQ